MKKLKAYLVVLVTIGTLHSCASGGNGKIYCPKFTNQEIQQKRVTDFAMDDYKVHLKEGDITTIDVLATE